MLDLLLLGGLGSMWLVTLQVWFAVPRERGESREATRFSITEPADRLNLRSTHPTQNHRLFCRSPSNPASADSGPCVIPRPAANPRPCDPPGQASYPAQRPIRSRSGPLRPQMRKLQPKFRRRMLKTLVGTTAPGWFTDFVFEAAPGTAKQQMGTGGGSRWVSCSPIPARTF